MMTIWPKRIGCGQAEEMSQMAVRWASQKAKSGNVFAQRRKRTKMLRAGVYARVPTNDQQPP